MIALFCGFFGGFNFHFLILTMINWVVVSNIFYFHPEHWGRFSPILTCAYFSDGWFNHQQVKYDKKHSFIGKASHCSSQARSFPRSLVNPWIQVDPRPLSWWVTELERMWGGHGEPREGNPSWLGLEGKKCVGKIWRKRHPGCFIWLYSFGFFFGE